MSFGHFPWLLFVYFIFLRSFLAVFHLEIQYFLLKISKNLSQIHSSALVSRQLFVVLGRIFNLLLLKFRSKTNLSVRDWIFMHKSHSSLSRKWCENVRMRCTSDVCEWISWKSIKEFQILYFNCSEIEMLCVLFVKKYEREMSWRSCKYDMWLTAWAVVAFHMEHSCYLLVKSNICLFFHFSSLANSISTFSPKYTYRRRYQLQFSWQILPEYRYVGKSHSKHIVCV